MREESHLDDMRAAIRGDFERLAERRGEQELMRVREDPEPAAEGEPLAQAEAPLAEEPLVDEMPPAGGESADAEVEPKRSWVDRLFGG